MLNKKSEVELSGADLTLFIVVSILTTWASYYFLGVTSLIVGLFISSILLIINRSEVDLLVLLLTLVFPGVLLGSITIFIKKDVL